MAPWLASLRTLLESLLVAVIFALFVRTYVVQVFKIPSPSMEPNLLIGDHILVNKFIYGPRATDSEEALLPMRDVRRGDVVVFKHPKIPERDFVKRCVALGGDEVAMVDKQLLVNGEPIAESGYVYHSETTVYPQSLYLPEGYRNRDNLSSQNVPSGYAFCLGDNRDESNDSRFWGPVPGSYMKGRALLVLWSTVQDGSRDESPPLRPGRSLRLVR
jgi:signal peptidase I